MTKKKTLSKADEKKLEKANKEARIAQAIIDKKAMANEKGRLPAFTFDSEARTLSAKLKDSDVEAGLAGTDHSLEVMRVLGVDRFTSSSAMISSLASAQGKDSDVEAQINGTLALVEQIAPNDPIETMLSVQMVTTHIVAMELVGLTRSNLTTPHFEKLARHAERMLRIYGQQVSILGKYRNGGKQTVEVKHVHVGSGGQAIIGDVHTG